MTVTTEAIPQPPVDFETAVEPYRRELAAHCYRMTGSSHDAEDLVQEVMLRAWRAWDRFEGRASVRTWLHRIATNTCLSALEGAARRPLPAGLGTPGADPSAPVVERLEVPWLQAWPGVVGADDDPATVATERESVRLAFVAALQHLPAKQRAVLLLREVLSLSALETADALGTTVAGVNSALQRARAQLARLAPERDVLVDPDTPQARRLLESYVACFENYDIAGLAALFSTEAVWEMPPFDGWYAGAAAIMTLIRTQCPAQGPGDMRMLPTSANGQPAFALYMRDGSGQHRAFHVQVLDLTAAGIAHVTAFFDPDLFAELGLPASL